AIGLTALLAVIAALTGTPGAQAIRVWAAAIGFAFAFRGWHDAVGRRRRVRGWIALALGIWLISETARLLAAWTGQPALLAELSVVVFAVASAGTYVAVVHGRMRRADEMAFYLDAAAVFFGLMAVVVLVGAGLLNDGQSVSLLAHGAF